METFVYILKKSAAHNNNNNNNNNNNVFIIIWRLEILQKVLQEYLYRN